MLIMRPSASPLQKVAERGAVAQPLGPSLEAPLPEMSQPDATVRAPSGDDVEEGPGRPLPAAQARELRLGHPHQLCLTTISSG